MRVLFVNSMRGFGGGERWLLEVAVGLISRGHEVALAVRRGSALGERAGSAGLLHRAFGMTGDVDPLSIAGLARWTRRLGPDLVCVSIKRAVRLGCASARLAGVRAVVERRGLLLPVEPNRFDRMVYGGCVSHVVANCEAIRRSLVEGGLVTSDRVSVIPNGIDPGRVPSGGGEAVRSELGVGRDDPLVAIVGRLVRDKGHEHALRAFSRIARRMPTARLVVVGAGKLRGEITALSRRIAPPGSVIFVGERQDVAAILDASDALLVASLREGMPHVILEAMAAGTPVVATAVAGIPEMIDDGVDGLLVPAGSDDALADALGRVLSDRDLADRLADAAGRRVRCEFGLEPMIDRFEDRFAGVVARVRGGETRP